MASAAPGNAIPVLMAVTFTVRDSILPWPLPVVTSATGTWAQGNPLSWASSVGWFPLTVSR